MSKRTGMFFVTAVLAALLFGCAGAKEDRVADSDTGLQNREDRKSVV